jgi:hypothetical protein
MICCENMNELYGLLGQHNKDLSSADTDALLDKIRAMSRREEDMYGNK